jgi:uncharacterized protein (DUF1499 family)
MYSPPLIYFFLFILTLPVPAFPIKEILSVMKLKQCPTSPNCVSSQSQSELHKITPLLYKSSSEQAMQQIKKTILAFPRTKLIEEKEHYLHVEFRTLFFRFIDDVEIVIDDLEKVIHLRSASRVGHSDFGTNRRRIEEIKSKFMQ